MDLTRDQRETSSHGPRPDEQTRWRTVRRYLNRNRYRLAQVAAGLYPEARRVGPTALLTRDQWLPNGPVALDRIELVLSPEVVVASISGRERESSRVRPVQANGERFLSYAEALAALDPPGMFENRPCYRLLDLGWNDSDRGQMRFGRGTYFDGVNTCEAVAHELADAMLDAGNQAVPPGLEALPFRSLIGDPCDLSRRPVLPAISTLTLRRDSSGDASFLLHWRDAARVVHGGGMYQVMPVGVFQPSSAEAWNEANDFDLWRSMAREYSEELLGTSERYGSHLAPIDYDGWPFYRALTEARRSGQLRAYCLGLGIDPLSLAADMLTVVIVDDEAFDELFPSLVEVNEEGNIVSQVASQADDKQQVGIPLSEAVVERFVHEEPMQAAGAALLALAWRYRGALLNSP